jgi:malonyl-CoA/methylmalonyl-CoA synthetase
MSTGGDVATNAHLPWSVHLRPGSELPADPEELRRFLRRGNLPEALLGGGSNPALLAGDLALTHEELRRRAECVAGGLAAMGVTAETRVSLYAANSASWVLAYLGAQRAGATVNPLNPAYRAAEVEHILSDAQPSIVMVDRERRGLIERLRHGVAALMQIVELEDLPESDDVPPLPALDPSSPALIIYTSGTTGRPKGALLDHGNMLAQARGVIEAWRWEPEDRLVLALPLFHVHGLGIGLHGTLLRGASATLIPFSPEAVVHELQAGGTMFFGVPAMYQRLVEHLERHPVDLSHVRLFVSGSAPLPPALFARCREALGQPVLERYGITEGGIAVSNPYDGPRRAGRVGHPLPGVEVRLGEGDEIQLKGGQVFSEYWNNPRATREVFVEGWLRTGDVGEIGPDGSLAVRGRIKELIISGGFNVYPREVELVLETHPAVVEAAVAGLPSERWGEEVAAFVVARRPVTAEQLIAYTRDRLAPYKCPRQVHFLDALPRNSMGKVQRSELSA